MFKDITLGQFFPGNSAVHRLDPRVKIILTICYIILLFTVNKPISFGLLALGTAAVVKISKIPFRYIMKGIRPMLFIILFTVVLNLFLVSGTPVVAFKLFGVSIGITYEGIRLGAQMFFRLVLLIAGTSLLTLTTSPMMLTDGTELLLKPFEKIKVPSHEIAMMMSIAIRFIPTLAEETDKIMKAQTARGADFESGNIIKRAKAMIPLLVPLFVSAFRRADELATAMDARCYNGSKNRTRMKQMNLKKTDFISVILCVVFAVSVILAQRI